MSNDLQEWYSSLNELLQDICSFLSDECQNNKLSANARKKASLLIERSKVQLQDMSRLIPEIEEPQAQYVDMQSRGEKTTCPYLDLPAKDLTKESKRGYLLWKTRFLIRFEKMRNVFAGIHGEWFLIYTSNQDLKPVQILDLRYCEVRNVSRDRKNEDRLFEVTYTLGKRKTFVFVAQTHKDMLQWVARINNYNTLMTEESAKEETETDIEAEAIYDDITILSSNQNKTQEANHEKLKTAPPLPFRLDTGPFMKRDESDSEVEYDPVIEPSHTVPIVNTRSQNDTPTIISPFSSRQLNAKQEESESDAEYDIVVEPVEPSDTISSVGNSFSEDDEDELYETFVDQKSQSINANIIAYRNNESVSQETIKENASKGRLQSLSQNGIFCDDDGSHDDEEELYCELVQK